MRRLAIAAVLLGMLCTVPSAGWAQRPKKPQTIDCRCTCSACSDKSGVYKCYKGSATDFQTTSSGSGSGACELIGSRIGCTILNTPDGDLRGFYSSDCKLTGKSVRTPEPGSLPPLTPSEPGTRVPKAPISPAPIDPAR